MLFPSDIRLQNTKTIQMNKLTLPIVALALAGTMQSCYKEGPDHNWDRGIDDSIPKVDIEPFKVDSDGDGVPDKTIEMTGDMGSDTYADGSQIQKECFNNSVTKCLQGGGLYLPESANNKPIETIFNEVKKALDKDGDGTMDAASEITETVVPAVSDKISTVSADSVVSQVLVSPDLANVATVTNVKVAESIAQIDKKATYDADELSASVVVATQSVFAGGSSSEIYKELAVAIKSATDAAVKKQIASNPSFIDEEQMQVAIQDAIAATVQDVVQEYIQKAVQAAVLKSLTETVKGDLTASQIAAIAADIAKVSSQNIASDLVTAIAAEQAKAVQSAISETIYNEPQYEPAPVQGLCSEGFHIPSDREWKEIELSFGMPASEVHLSGERAVRGASVGMAKKFETALNLQYGGYGTADGRFAQYGEVSIFATSSVGKDADGEYIWVRYIDKMGDHDGIIRKKLRKGTLMSVRCIK